MRTDFGYSYQDVEWDVVVNDMEVVFANYGWWVKSRLPPVLVWP
jgi:hypothetical protein